MAKKSKKKIVSTNKKQAASKKEASSKKNIVKTSSPQSSNLSNNTSSPQRASRGKAVAEPLLFGKENYLWMLLGFGLIVIGMFLMMGGNMPDNNTWDESLIYSTRRTLIAPMVILAGLIIEFFAIFRN